MASQNKIIEMIGSVKTIYPYYAKDLTDHMIETLIKTWGTLLHSYSDEVVEAAFFHCLQTCKMPPTPADVIEQIKSMNMVLEPSNEELWSTYMDSLRITYDQMSRFGHNYVDSTGISQGQQARNKVDNVWNNLPEKIKSYLGSKGELMRNAQSWGVDAAFGTWEKPRFMKAMPIMEKRQEYSGLMLNSGGNKLLLD